MVETLRSLADASRVQAAERPDHTALIFEGRTLTYGALDRNASRVAHGLAGLGLPPQSRVAFLSKNTPRFYELLLGAAKSRNVLVGVNMRLAPPEVKYVLDDSQSRVLFVGRDFYGLAESLEGRLESVGTIVALDGGHPRWPDYTAWREAQSAEDPALEIGPGDDVQQLYTSGTTGHPKGVQLTHGAWMAFQEAVISAGWARYEPDDTVLVSMPMFHVAGANGGILALLQGARVVVAADISPEILFDVVPRYGVNYTLLVPALILMVVGHADVGRADFSSLRTITYGASPIAESLLERAREVFGCELVQLYGQTENLGGSTYLPWADHAPGRGKLRSCGIPYPGCEIRIVDPNGNPLPPGEVGEIAVRCGWLMKGYWRRPEATAETLRDGWLMSGDAGWLDGEGFLYIHDRIKDMIVSGGENVYPAEVENALFGHPAIADVAVIGVPDDRWGEAVRAIVVLNEGHALTAEELIEYGRSRIAAYKLPKAVDFVDALPRNASGKILRRELRARYWQGRDRTIA